MKAFRLVFSLTFGLMGLVFLIVGLICGAVTSADPDMPVLAAVFSGLGGLFLVLGIAFFFLLDGARRRRKLLETGIRATATVTDIRQDRTIQYNRRCPYRIYATCTHPVTRETVEVRSHPLFQMQVSTGQTIDVAFHPMKERRYAFDIEEDKA